MKTDNDLENVQRLLEELEQLVDRSSVHMFGKVVVDEERFFMVTHKIRNALPENLKRADQLTRDRDRLIESAHQEAQRITAQARREAERIVDEAHERARQLVAQDTITQAALREVAELRQRAEQDAENVRAESDQYALEIFQRLQGTLERLGQAVDQSLEQLRRRQGDAQHSSRP